MILIWGTKHYGQVDAHGGQYATTRFFHIWYLPLVPEQSMWVTNEANGLWGHPIKTSTRSVLAGYARVWGVVAAVGGAAMAVTGGLAGIPIGVAGAAAAGWSWTWRRLRRDRDRLRSDFHLLAYGTRCDPLQMPEQMVHMLRADTDARWAQVSDGKSPEDVARLGAADLRQAVFAYGALRLAARVAPGAAGEAARRASEELLARYAGADLAVMEGGPYRSPPALGGSIGPR